MGETALVESQMADAFAIIRKLDQRGDVPSVAAWYLDEKIDEWKLLIAGGSFDRLLKKEVRNAYRKIVEAMAEVGTSSLAVSDIQLISTDSKLSKAISKLISTGPQDLTRAHCVANSVNGIFLKEAIVLRSANPPGTAVEAAGWKE
ncbi:MAG: hypothetical protein ACODAD_08045 [Planctomycetota bacterium]